MALFLDYDMLRVLLGFGYVCRYQIWSYLFLSGLNTTHFSTVDADHAMLVLACVNVIVRFLDDSPNSLLQSCSAAKQLNFLF